MQIPDRPHNYGIPPLVDWHAWEGQVLRVTGPETCAPIESVLGWLVEKVGHKEPGGRVWGVSMHWGKKERSNRRHSGVP